MLCIYTMTQTHLNNALKATDSIPYGVDAKPVVVGANFMNMEQEIWKSIDGFGGTFEASTLGRIRSIERIVIYKNGRKHKYPSCILSSTIAPNGYRIVNLAFSGDCKSSSVHRLIAKTFIPNPENKYTVNHINGIKTDNRLVNLEWMTQSENQYHALSLGLWTSTKGRKNLGVTGKNHGASRRVRQSDLFGNEIKIWDSISEAERGVGISHSCIIGCCKKQRNTSKGFKWEYVN